MYDKVNDVDMLDDIWVSGSRILIKARKRHQILIQANKKGYLTLAKLFGSIAKYGINSSHNDENETEVESESEHFLGEKPFDDSYWMDNDAGYIDIESSCVCLAMDYDPDDLPN